MSAGFLCMYVIGVEEDGPCANEPIGCAHDRRFHVVDGARWRCLECRDFHRYVPIERRCGHPESEHIQTVVGITGCQACYYEDEGARLKDRRDRHSFTVEAEEEARV